MKKSLKQFSKKATGLLLAVAVTGTSFGLPGLTREVRAEDLVQPILQLGFDEESGNAALDSASQTPFDIEGTAQFVKGEIGNALQFDGSTQIYVPESSAAFDFNVQPNYTFSAWIYPDSVGTGTSMTILSRQTENSYRNSWILGEHNSKLYFQHGTNDGAGRENMYGSLQGGEWQHVAVTADGDVLKFYINGEEVGQDTVNGRTGNLQTEGKSLLIGDKVASQRRPFKGAMDELKIYNSTLSSEEIKAQYEYNMNPFTLTAENGKLVLDFEKDFTEEPVIEDFAVTMHNSVVDPTQTKPVELINCTVDGLQVTLEFDPVTAVGSDQTIDMAVTYNRVTRDGQYVVAKYDDPNPPSVSNVTVEGTPDVKAGLTVNYDYEDTDGEVESRSKIEWWISPAGDKDGEYTKLEGIRTKDIYLISYYTDRYLKAMVTPVNEKYAEGEPVMSEPVGPIENKGNQEVKWFRDGKYGIMHHFLHDYITLAAANEDEKLKPEENWDAYLDSFDVDAYVEDILETGASFVIFTIGQHDGFFNAHNPVYDKYAQVEEGERTPSSTARDLPMEIAKALEPHGIKMMFYAVGCPPFRAHRNFGPNFDAATNPHDGDYGITDAFGQTRNTDTPPTQETLKKWQEVLGYWSEHYGEYLAGWWIDGMWTSENSMRGNTYEVNPDLTPNANANPNAAYAPTKEYNWHTWVDALKKGNSNRILSLSLGGSDEINVPYEDYVGGEAHPPTNFNSVCPRNPALSQMDGWASQELGIQWFFMSSMGVPVPFYGYWGQKGAAVDTEQVTGWFKNNVEKNAVLVSDSRVNRFGRIDPDQMEQWKRIKAVVKGGDHLKPMETYNDHWYFTKYYDQNDNDTADWTYVNNDGNYYHSDYTYTTNDGSYFEFEFCGTGVEFYTAKTAEMGEVDIYIDGELCDTINLQSGNAQFQQKVYEVSGLNEGIHTIKGVKKNGSKLAVDFFKVLGEVERPAETETFTTTFIVDGVETTVVTNAGEQIQMPADPVKDGYTFKGWFTAETGGEKVTDFTAAQTVYAQWEETAVTEPVSKKTLEYFLNKAKEHVANGDTADLIETIQNLFREAIEEGDAVMENDAATKEDVTKATVQLMKAINALDFLAGDKTDLEMALELTQLIDLNKYVEAGQAEYLAAKSGAEAVMANGDAMQEDVDAAWSALVEAMDNLRLKANKAVLQELLESLKDLDLNIYTEASVEVYMTALAKANGVMEDDSLSVDDQKTVDNAVKELKQAKADLKEKEGNNGNSGNNGNNGNSGSNENNGSSGNTGTSGNGATVSQGTGKVKSAKTGDTAMVGIWLGVLGGSMLLGAAAVFLMRRRKKR